MKVDLGKKIRSANDDIAERLRERFASSGTYVFNLVSAPGSGKTTLLEETTRLIGDDLVFRCIVGDIQTEADADRLRAAGLESEQIETLGSCHLDAAMIDQALESLPPEGVDLLAIENIGNLVCPVSFDLGEDAKVALVSLPEGGDKPSKYPSAFARAEAFVVTKIDLAPHLDCDEERLLGDALAINPDLKVIRLSARTGEGMDEWTAWLRDKVAQKKRG